MKIICAYCKNEIIPERELSQVEEVYIAECECQIEDKRREYEQGYSDGLRDNEMCYECDIKCADTTCKGRL